MGNCKKEGLVSKLQTPLLIYNRREIHLEKRVTGIFTSFGYITAHNTKSRDIKA